MNKPLKATSLVLGVAVGTCIAVICQDGGQRCDQTSFSDNLDYGKPSENVLVIERKGYALGYNRKWKIAEWVSYRLTRDEVLSNVCDRADLFVKDPLLSSDFSIPEDYLRSGYDRGHLAPAADMHWSQEVMAESFYMSNMTPQAPQFNRGIWKHLEKWVRDMALVETNIVVVTGPIVASNDLTNTIGRNKVVVPSAFYKVILDETPPRKMIGFILENKGSSLSITNSVVTVDEVEKVTGLDFFKMLPDDKEDELEARADFISWKKGIEK